MSPRIPLELDQEGHHPEVHDEWPPPEAKNIAAEQMDVDQMESEVGQSEVASEVVVKSVVPARGYPA